MVLITIALVFFTFVVFCALSPFLLWKSFFYVFRAVLLERDLSFKGRSSMIWHLITEIAVQPIFGMLWLIDEILWSEYKKTEVQPPVFIMSQPRSGTTFLLRTLASDEKSFFVLKHLDWRVPFIGVWRLIDRFGLRKKLESIDYWPSTEIGRLASKIHFHNLGSVEGHGVFFEERMYHHYFTFRRFPFPEVLKRVSGVGSLTVRERRKLVGALKKSVMKAAYYRGGDRYWLTKENENVDLFRLVYEAFPNARFLVIVREPKDFVRSYIKMSDACTTPKHGVDPNFIPGWYDANLQFRREECEKHIAFCQDLEKKNAITYVTFEEFTADVHGTIDGIYKNMDISMSPEFGEHLRQLQKKQDVRVTGYDNPNKKIAGFDEYTEFAAQINAPKMDQAQA